MKFTASPVRRSSLNVQAASSSSSSDLPSSAVPITIQQRRRRRRSLRHWQSSRVAARLGLPLSILCVSYTLLRLLLLGVNHSFLVHRHALIVDPLWHNKYNVVHVIQTRFMQHQAKLVDLGRARLLELQSITLQSLQQQNNQEFLWIVRTDPKLEASLKQGLVEILQDMPNVVVLASLENPEGFRGTDTMHGITASDVWVGSWEVLQAYWNAAQTRVVLETRLDADDGLATDFVEIVQSSTTLNHVDAHAWTVQCVQLHLEWQQVNPWQPENVQGALVGVAGAQCVTAGLTFGYQVQAKRSTIPCTGHHTIHKVLPKCGASNINCWSYLVADPPTLPLALRARTITSAGMNHVVLGNSTNEALAHSHWRDQQDEAWDLVQEEFGIADLQVLHAHLTTHATAIAADNLRGQCTRGHSCKDTSKAALQQVLRGSNRSIVQ